MSTDVVRVFSTEIGPNPRRKRGSWLRIILVCAFIFSVAGFFAVTRDSYPLAHLVPSNAKYGVVVTGLVGSRGEVAQSAVWKALPPALGLGNVPRLLGENTVLPEWVLNNLLGDLCYAQGNDVKTFRDLVFISRMTRVGKLITVADRLIPGIHGDHAGGLRLRRLGDAGPYFATRGRLLAISPSRDALIRVLTLEAKESAAQEILLASLGKAGAEHIRGSVRLEPSDPMGSYLQSVGFAARIEPDAARVKFRLALSADLSQRLAPLLEGLETKPLPEPIPGLIAISANFGKPIAEVWAAVGSVLPYPVISKEQWDRWAQIGPSGQPTLPQMATNLLGPTGPGFRLSLCRVDQNEVLPLPILAGFFEAQPDKLLQSVAASWPPLPEKLLPWDSIPRYETDKARMRLPMVFGPSLELTAGAAGQYLLMSTSRTEYEALTTTPPPAATLSEQGNLYLRVQPVDCVKTVAEAGRQFAEVGLLKGYTLDQYNSVVAEWLNQAQALGPISGLAAYSKGEVTVDIGVSCPPQTDATPAQTPGGSS